MSLGASVGTRTAARFCPFSPASGTSERRNGSLARRKNPRKLDRSWVPSICGPNWPSRLKSRCTDPYAPNRCTVWVRENDLRGGDRPIPFLEWRRIRVDRRTSLPPLPLLRLLSPLSLPSSLSEEERHTSMPGWRLRCFYCDPPPRQLGARTKATKPEV